MPACEVCGLEAEHATGCAKLGAKRRVILGRAYAHAERVRGHAAKTVYRLLIVRENGDSDELCLCTDCKTTIADFATITEEHVDPHADCDRCGYTS